MMIADDESHQGSLQHILVIWLALFGILIGAFAVTVIVLNSTLYSAGGFVTSYLQSLERHDLNGALATPGVQESSQVSRELLVPQALTTMKNITITSDSDQGAGIHFVSYSATVGGVSGSGTFQVLRGENRFGVFSSWAFLQSPISMLTVTPLHEASFAVNGVNVASPDGASVAATFQVLTPGSFAIAHDSRYLTAVPVKITVTRPGSTGSATLDVQASSYFVSTLQKQVDEFLDACTTQHVLFPTGCPFGQEISNQVESSPHWTIASYPTVTIEPGNDPGTWLVPETQANAHLTVDVRSLFDGTVSTFDEDVPFSIAWVMTFDGDRIDIKQQ